MNSDRALELVAKHAIPLSRDFHTLGNDVVCRIIEAADDYRYRKPRNANGSRARYFYALLSRAANKWKPSEPRPERWKVKAGRYIVDADNVLIADLYADTAEDFGIPDTDQIRRNIRLILAAPRLLELLRRGEECGIFAGAPVYRADVVSELKKAKGDE